MEETGCADVEQLSNRTRYELLKKPTEDTTLIEKTEVIIHYPFVNL